MILSADIKGEAYEGLVERNAQDTKSGAWQYFTTRPLIDAIIGCLAPKPGETMIDPASGTGGFLIAMFLYIVEHFREMTREQRDHLRYKALHGIDIVQSVVRLCAMNLLLHNVGPSPAQLDANLLPPAFRGLRRWDGHTKLARSGIPCPPWC